MYMFAGVIETDILTGAISFVYTVTVILGSYIVIYWLIDVSTAVSLLPTLLNTSVDVSVHRLSNLH